MKFNYSKFDRSVFQELFGSMIETMNKVVVGQSFQLDLFLSCLIAKEHISFAGESGIGKTFLVEKFIELLNLKNYYEMLTGHPEIMPQDFSVRYKPHEDGRITMEPIMLQKASIFFVDEFNRISPKSLNALLAPLNSGKMHDDITDSQIRLGYCFDADEQEARQRKKQETLVGELSHEPILNQYLGEIRKKIDAKDNGEKIRGQLQEIVDKLQDKIKFKLNKIKIVQVKLNEIQYLRFSLEKEAEQNVEILPEFREDISNLERGIKTLEEQVAALKVQLAIFENCLFGAAQYEEIDLKWLELRIEANLHDRKLIAKKVLAEQAKSVKQIAGYKTTEKEKQYFFFCVLARNPVSRGGNFPPPDALLDRLGMEIQFYNLDEESKKKIATNGRDRGFEKRTFEAWQKDVVGLVTKTNCLPLPINMEAIAHQSDWFFHCLQVLDQKIYPNDTQADRSANRSAPPSENMLAMWCNRYMAALISPKQLIVEVLVNTIHGLLHELERKHLGIDYISNQVRPWAEDLHADLIEMAQEKITRPKIWKILLKSHQLDRKVMGRVYSPWNQILLEGGRASKKLSTRIRQTVLKPLVEKIYEELPFIYRIEVGSSGRMASSLEKLVISYAFIQGCRDKSISTLPDERFYPEFSESNHGFYKAIFKKIAFYVTCHRIRFMFGSNESDKQKVTNYAIAKAFGDNFKVKENWFKNLADTSWWYYKL